MASSPFTETVAAVALAATANNPTKNTLFMP